MTMEITPKELASLTLLFAAENSNIEGRTRLQKLLFLLDKEEIGDEKTLYGFKKYDYGPFSKKLLDDVERFERNRIVDIDTTRTFGGNKRYDYSLTDDGKEQIDSLIETDERAAELYEKSREVLDRYETLGTRELVERIYDEYPEYKENSVYKY